MYICQASLGDNAISGVLDVGASSSGAPGFEATLSTDASNHGTMPFLEKVSVFLNVLERLRERGRLCSAYACIC